MGLPAQPRMTSGSRLGARRGIALPASLLAVVAIGLLAAGAWVVVDLNARSASNREASIRALHLAEAGAAHALSLLEVHLDEKSLTHLLLGSDSLASTADDGLLIGHGIPADDQIPSEGFDWGDGTYTVRLYDDPNEGDGNALRDRNGRILVRCSGLLADGGTATVDFVYGTDPIPPAIISAGPITLGGSVELRGSCGGVYANDSIRVTGDLVAEQSVISSSAVVVTGSIVDPEGNTFLPLVNQAPVSVPTFDLWDTCDQALYILQTDGWILRTSDGEMFNAGQGSSAFGWKRKSNNPVVWELQAAGAVSATFCVKGNANIIGNLGQGTPFPISIFATGGISLVGNSDIEAFHPDGYLLMAKGDLKIAGNPASGTIERYGGMLYAGSQCGVSGNPQLSSQMYCGNAADPAGAANYASSNDISGNVRFTYNCDTTTSTVRRALAWFQRFGE